MYINDTYIGFYLLAAIVGLAIGQLVDWMNERLVEGKKVFSRDIFRKYKIEFKPNYILMLITATIYIGLIYKFGIQDSLIENLNLIKYLILTPIILSIFVMNYKKQDIPDRLNLTMFEIGIIVAFLYGVSNIAITIDMLLGMVAGVAILLVITLIRCLFYGKEAFETSNLKFIGALGLYFGLTNIAIISIIAFLIGIVTDVILSISKCGKDSKSISFGIFIVIAAFITIFIPFETLLYALKMIFTLGMKK